MICVKAQGDPMGKIFWIAKVIDILTKIDGVPDKIKITWFTTESHDNPLEGKYYPEKSKSSQKLLEDELCLSNTTVHAYNFALLGNKSLPAATKKIIETALVDNVGQIKCSKIIVDHLLSNGKAEQNIGLFIPSE